MSLTTNEYYQQLKSLHNVVGGVLNLVESQDIWITELERQIEDDLQASESEISLRIRAELKAQFDVAFTDSLALIGASSQQLQFIRDSLVGELPPPPPVIEPDEPLIPNL
jgi:hypothetical protein